MHTMGQSPTIPREVAWVAQVGNSSYGWRGFPKELRHASNCNEPAMGLGIPPLNLAIPPAISYLQRLDNLPAAGSPPVSPHPAGHTVWELLDAATS